MRKLLLLSLLSLLFLLSSCPHFVVEQLEDQKKYVDKLKSGNYRPVYTTSKREAGKIDDLQNYHQEMLKDTNYQKMINKSTRSKPRLNLLTLNKDSELIKNNSLIRRTSDSIESANKDNLNRIKDFTVKDSIYAEKNNTKKIRNEALAGMDTNSSENTRTEIADAESVTEKDTINTYTLSLSSAGINLSSQSREVEKTTSKLEKQIDSTKAVLPYNLEILSVNADEYPDSIRIKANVYDYKGNFITGLAPPNFKGEGSYKTYWHQLYDSTFTREREIFNYNVKEFNSSTSEAHSIAFVLDHSSSMGHKRTLKLQQATKYTMRALKNGDWVSVIKFTNIPDIEVPLTNDKKTYFNDIKVDGLESAKGAGTSIYDATAVAIEELKKGPDSLEKVIILFTDGQDGNSNISIDSVQNLAKENKVTIHTIAYGWANTEPMELLAKYTGGRFYHIFSSKEFKYVFADIYLKMSNYYLITYHPPKENNRHIVDLGFRIPNSGLPEIFDQGEYDKSVFTWMDPIGTSKLLNIEFEFGTANINKDSEKLVEKVAIAMKNNKKLKILIKGHTDNIGNEEDNMTLSEDRAKAVKDLLVEMGISEDRLQTQGFGETAPLFPNDSEENRHKNRRTEFEIIK